MKAAWLMAINYILMSIFTCFGFPGETAHAQPKELVGYWMFDDKDNLSKDSGIYGNDAQKAGNGKVEWSSNGKFGGALLLNGNSWLEAPDSDSLSIDGEQVSVMAWVNFSAIGDFYQSVVAKKGPGGDKHAAYHLTLIRNGYIGGGFFFDALTEKGRALNSIKPQEKPKTWYHIAGVYDGNSQRMYLDGKLALGNGQDGFDNPQKQSGKLIKSEEPLLIGNGWDGTIMHGGLIDDVAIFNRALTAEEIEKAMRLGVAAGVLVVDFSGKLATTWSRLKW
ncbi:LamG domain-containing protein [Candidatus Poribacteria bacterium]|nr:LamG domain-containing protein [Candidatus Poribacteria bacterium]